MKTQDTKNTETKKDVKNNAKNANRNGKNAKTNKDAKNGKKDVKKDVTKVITVKNAFSDKILQYADNRKNKINANRQEALQYANNKMAANVVINRTGIANRYDDVTTQDVIDDFILFVKCLKHDLPKQLIGLLKKHGSDVILNHVSDSNIHVLLDNQGKIKSPAVVRLVCKFSPDIAGILKNARELAKASQSKQPKK